MNTSREVISCIELHLKSSSHGTDFLVQNGTEIIPVEVKGGEEKSAPSFKTYIKHKQQQTALRYSKRGYVTNSYITSLPLNLAKMIKELILQLQLGLTIL